VHHLVSEAQPNRRILDGGMAGPQTPVMPVRPDAPPLTVEHYRMLPETGPRYQLINGDLHMSPATNRYHQVISRNLEFILLQYLEEQPLGGGEAGGRDPRLTAVTRAGH
jgi:Uma2 family endonuclease